jgi:hypothetical protein
VCADVGASRVFSVHVLLLRTRSKLKSFGTLTSLFEDDIDVLDETPPVRRSSTLLLNDAAKALRST